MSVLNQFQLKRLQSERDASTGQTAADNAAGETLRQLGYSAGVERANICSLEELREFAVEEWVLRDGMKFGMETLPHFKPLLAEHGRDYVFGFASACRSALNELSSVEPLRLEPHVRSTPVNPKSSEY